MEKGEKLAMDYDIFFELVKKRRSIRRFKPDPIPDEYIDKIIEAARWAPSGANSQPWEFIVIKDKETKEKIGRFIAETRELTRRVEYTREPEARHPGADRAGGRPGYLDAPVFIMLCGDLRAREAYPLSTFLNKGRETFFSSLASAFLYMHLAASTLGLASQWVSATANTVPQVQIKALLGIPKDLEIYDTMAMGYPASEPRPKLTREREEMVHREKFDTHKFRTAEQVRQFIINIHKADADIPR